MLNILHIDYWSVAGNIAKEKVELGWIYQINISHRPISSPTTVFNRNLVLNSQNASIVRLDYFMDFYYISDKSCFENMLNKFTIIT